MKYTSLTLSAILSGVSASTSKASLRRSLKNYVIVENDKTIAIVLGCVFGVLLLIAILYVLFLRLREKQGIPVFARHSTNGTDEDKEKPEIDVGLSDDEELVEEELEPTKPIC
jgi:hypothetical protein